MNGKWSQSEFAYVDLGDKRLNDRLFKPYEDFIKPLESRFNPGTFMFGVV